MVVLGRGAPEQVIPVFDVAGYQFKAVEGQGERVIPTAVHFEGDVHRLLLTEGDGIVFGRGSGAVVLGRGVLSSWVGARAGAVRHSVNPEGGMGGSTARTAVMSSGSGGAGGFFGRPRFFLLLKV